MGLDVYLYRYERPAEEIEAEEEQYETASNRVWEEIGGARKYEEMTEAERDEASRRTKAIAADMGLGDWGSHPARAKIEEPSAKGTDPCTDQAERTATASVHSTSVRQPRRWLRCSLIRRRSSVQPLTPWLRRTTPTSGTSTR